MKSNNSRAISRIFYLNRYSYLSPSISTPSLATFWNFLPSNSGRAPMAYSSTASVKYNTSKPFFKSRSTKGDSLTWENKRNVSISQKKIIIFIDQKIKYTLPLFHWHQQHKRFDLVFPSYVQHNLGGRSDHRHWKF